MYRFYINSKVNDKHYGDMLRVFFAEEDFEVIVVDFPRNTELHLREGSFYLNNHEHDDRNEIKKEILSISSELTGINPEWGILTGVRPLKLALDVLEKSSSREEFNFLMKEYYLVSDKKISLLNEIIDYQKKFLAKVDGSAALYVHIPFCPTKCTYCSFASEEYSSVDEVDRYLEALYKEIDYSSELARSNNMSFESVYIGGGTPTTLTGEQLEGLLSKSISSFGINPSITEFTVEAGRPDTLDESKFEALQKCGISRISINPQSMHDATLRAIGRNHTSKQIEVCYRLAGDYDFDCINADLIAGLSDETPDEFRQSLEKIVSFGAENITIHTLSVKRGSKLKEKDPNFYMKDTLRVSTMLDEAHEYLKSMGYSPYYIYRQKHQMGALENVGYCLDGKHSLYNIRIMEEKQTIFALGAGGIGKLYNPEDGSLTRIPNVGNYRVYIERIDEMLNRKNKYFI